MEYTLTNQEIAKLETTGGNIAEAQEAKKQAYLKAGGIILNPDALSDLYEALDIIIKHFRENVEPLYSGDLEILNIGSRALAKAGGGE